MCACVRFTFLNSQACFLQACAARLPPPTRLLTNRNELGYSPVADRILKFCEMFAPKREIRVPKKEEHEEEV